MADKKISALTAASTPLAGTEVLPIVQGGSTVKVSAANLTAGRVVSASGVAIAPASFKNWSVVKAMQVGTGASFGGGDGFADGFATCNSYYDGSNWRRIAAAGASQVALTPSTGLRFNIAGSGAADSTMTWTEVGSFSALADFTVNSGNLVIGTSGKGITTGSAIPLGLGVNNAVNAITIDTASNVGIGTPSPATKLQIQQTTGTSGFESGFSLTNAVDSNLFMQITGSANADKRALISTSTTTAIAFSTASTERMRIESGGNVGIGTTTPAATALLDVQSTTKGVRFPNMTTTQKNAITPAAGTVIFDTTLAKLCVYSGAAWQTITSV